VSIAANAAPVQDDLVIATVDNIDEVQSRETRSSDPFSLRPVGIPWHLDRIDQRKQKLDKKYNSFANGQ